MWIIVTLTPCLYIKSVVCGENKMAASTNEAPLRRWLEKCCCGSEFQTGSRKMLRAQTEGCVSGGCWQGDLLLHCFPEYVVGGHPGRLCGNHGNKRHLKLLKRWVQQDRSSKPTRELLWGELTQNGPSLPWQQCIWQCSLQPFTKNVKHMKLSGGQTSCHHQRVAFVCCIRGYGLITHFTGTHGNRKYGHLCKHHQERHKQWEACESTARRILKSRPSTWRDLTRWCVNPEMIQRQQGLFGLTHPLDHESTSSPNGSSCRHQS